MAHEDSDTAKPAECLGELAARCAVKVVRGLVDREHVGALPQGACDLQLFPLAVRELVKPPGHVVFNAEHLAQTARFAVVRAGELVEVLGRRVRLLSAVNGEQAVRDLAGIRRKHSAGDLRKRGLATAVIAQKAGPAGREGDGDGIENGVGNGRVGVRDASQRKLRRASLLMARRHGDCRGRTMMRVIP